MIRKLYILYILLVCSSCHSAIYFPERVNSPGLAGKGDGKLIVSSKPSFSGPADSSNQGIKGLFNPSADIAYAVGERFGIIAAYRGMLSKEVKETYQPPRRLHDTIASGIFKGNRFEIGAGYFHSIRGKTNRILELYGGIGLGNINKKSYTYPSYDYRASYSYIFLQPAIGIAARDIVQFTGGINIKLLKYGNFTAINDDNTKYYVTSGNTTSISPDISSLVLAYLQSFANVEIGYRRIKYNMQFGYNIGLGNVAMVVGGSPFYFSTGISILVL